MKFGAGGKRFKAKWTESADGSKHPSKGEAQWWDRMRLRERAGEIRALEREPSFEVRIAKDCPHCAAHGERIGLVKLDAAYDDAAGDRIFEDYKGPEGETPLSKFKRRFVEARFGIKVQLAGPVAKQAARDKARRELLADQVASRRKS